MKYALLRIAAVINLSDCIGRNIRLLVTEWRLAGGIIALIMGIFSARKSRKNQKQ